MSRYPHPGNEDEFEEFCLYLLRRHWNSPHVDRYGRRGQRQHGVDLLDRSGLLPLRGAQCKHHSGLTALEPDELRAEVKKARKFLPALGIYVFMTSAKKSTETDRALLEINRRHRRTGSFTVELLTWEGIERLLEDYPDVAARLARVPAAAVTQAIAEVSQKMDGLRDAVGGGGFERRIERRFRIPRVNPEEVAAEAA